MSRGKKRVCAPRELPGEGSRHLEKGSQRSRREGPVDPPRVVHAAKTRARVITHSAREATGLAHQAVGALMSRLHGSREGPVGTPRDGQVRRVQVTRGEHRCRTPGRGGAQTVARRVYADPRLTPGSREEGAQRSRGGLEPDSGHPTVRDHREALGTVASGGTRIPLRHRKGGCRSLPSYSAARPVSIPICSYQAGKLLFRAELLILEG
jgi:hypothetical protein